jgi:ATP-dependent DNA helicase RecQ
MAYTAKRALALLRAGTQSTQAAFRDGQEEAIKQVVDSDIRLLLVQKTGWGKSFIYFIATKLLREEGKGPVILISPLLSLMRNQIEAATRMGVIARKIDSDNKNEWPEITRELINNQVDILLITPQRINNSEFRDNILPGFANRVSMVVIDEAHCISDWGHDFIPEYRLIERLIRQMPRNLRVLATTATANNRVLNDLQDVLGPNLAVSRGDLSRPSLFLQTIQMPHQADRMAWLADVVPQLKGSGIIYTLTVRDAERVAEWLKACGINAPAYTANNSSDQRIHLERALIQNNVKALVATVALGMGFDKPDIGFVIHYQTPGSVVAYYQQAGRAGRAVDAAYGILLGGKEDTDITDYFIDNAFPTKSEATSVLDALKQASTGLSLYEIMAAVNLSKGRIDKTLSLLALESPSPIAKHGTKWHLTSSSLSDEFWERTQRLTALRREEQKQMQAYVKLQSGHMDFLIRALDGTPKSFTPPALHPMSESTNNKRVQEAIQFLRRSNLPIEPRKQWPADAIPHGAQGSKIPSNRQMQPGRVLCVWGDAGWGKSVRDGKYQQQHFSDELVEACAALYRAWAPHPAPTWVTCIPSRRHFELVPDFARRLAARLNLPFSAALTKTDASRPEQKSMNNSSQQLRNVEGALVIHGSALHRGPVLLVDDLVDSRWTLTYAAWLLSGSGVPAVYPLALAASTRAGDE